LENTSFRGRLVHIGSALDLILKKHTYPVAVGKLLGEALVIGAALAASLKYEGVFTLQAKGDGPVRLLVADMTSRGELRAYAQIREGYDFSNVRPDARLLGDGHLAFTVDPKSGKDRYQGIVTLKGDNLSEAVRHYFLQSEQLPTGIMAAAQQDEKGHWNSVCLMLQRMPREGGLAKISDTSLEDDWNHAMLLMETCHTNELTDPALEPNDILYRLFHEDGVRVFDPKYLRHKCRCSKTRVTNMLRSMPRAEIESLAVNGLVTVTCEFCNRSYKFDEEKIKGLYSAGNS
jgi:molecular chaperone Hsp33